MTTVVEPLAPEDWEQFKALRLEMLTRSPSAFGSKFSRECGYDATQWRSFLQAFHPIVVKVDGETAGTAGYLAPPEEKPFQAKIVSMYVRPGFQRRGFARRLLQEIMSRIRKETEATEVVLTVYEENRRAFELYRSAGFRVLDGTGETSATADGRKELLMSLALQP